jgi:hypothetical protein
MADQLFRTPLDSCRYSVNGYDGAAQHLLNQQVMGMSCMAMLAAFPSTIMKSTTTEPAFSRCCASMVAIHLLFWQIFCQHGGHALAFSALLAWWLDTSCFSWYEDSPVSGHLPVMGAGGDALFRKLGGIPHFLYWLRWRACYISYAGVEAGGVHVLSAKEKLETKLGSIPDLRRQM